MLLTTISTRTAGSTASASAASSTREPCGSGTLCAGVKMRKVSWPAVHVSLPSRSVRLMLSSGKAMTRLAVRSPSALPICEKNAGSPPTLLSRSKKGSASRAVAASFSSIT